MTLLVPLEGLTLTLLKFWSTYCLKVVVLYVSIGTIVRFSCLQRPNVGRKFGRFWRGHEMNEHNFEQKLFWPNRTCDDLLFMHHPSTLRHFTTYLHD